MGRTTASSEGPGAEGGTRSLAAVAGSCNLSAPPRRAHSLRSRRTAVGIGTGGGSRVGRGLVGLDRSTPGSAHRCSWGAGAASSNCAGCSSRGQEDRSSA